MRPLLPLMLFTLSALAGHWSAPWLAPRPGCPSSFRPARSP
jgi:hypothetical protein